MLGLTLECARCHDHKFDPITQRDYYALGAFFNSIDESGLYSHFTSATPTPAMPLWPAGRREQHAALQARIARLESRLAAIAREARPGFAAWRRTARVTLPAPVVHLDFAAAPMPAADGDKDRSPRIADRASPTPARLHDDPQPVTDAARLAGADGVFAFSGDNAVVHHGAPIVPPHRSVLDRDPPAADRAPGSRRRRCTSRAPGPTPAAAATRSCSTTGARPSR